MKIRKNCYQFTAIDDCTRMRVLKLYGNKKAESSVNFLFYVLNNLPFPIQRIQTDWGTEFFAEQFQYELIDHFIKFRPIKPRSPHLKDYVAYCTSIVIWSTISPTYCFGYVSTYV